jgi:hypothetical protein
MLGAVLLGTLALTGTSGPLWTSDASPRAGQPYVAISYTGTDNFGCGASIGERHLRTVAYKIDNTIVCVFHIPKGTAGKTLMVGYFVSSSFFIADGAPMRRLIHR